MSKTLLRSVQAHLFLRCILLKRKPVDLAADVPPCCYENVGFPDRDQTSGYDSDTVEGQDMETYAPSWQEFANFDALPQAYQGFDADFADLDTSSALHSSFDLPELPSNNLTISSGRDAGFVVAPTVNQSPTSRQHPEAGSVAQAPATSETGPSHSPKLAAIEELRNNEGSISSRMNNGRRTTITLDDVDSTTLVAVMDILIKSNATVKFETQS